MNKHILVCAVLIILSACHIQSKKSSSDNTATIKVPTLNFELIQSYPHDENAFTEGLLIHNSQLFESTGAIHEVPQTRSLFGVVDLNTGNIDVKAELDKNKYFGEGITFLNGRVYQLTYKSKVGFIYDATTFKKISEFVIPSKEGWGMTTNGSELIMSDGTNMLTYLDPNTLQVIKRVSVTENGFAKDYLNELEYVKGYVYANIWTTNTIVKIDPKDGTVVGKLDLTSLALEAKNINYRSMEMNGIAYDSDADLFYITGKLWPKIYQIQIK